LTTVKKRKPGFPTNDNSRQKSLLYGAKASP